MTPQKMKRFGVFAIAFAFLAGCTNTAHIEKDPSTDLAKFKTYSWIHNEVQENKSKGHSNDLAEQKIRSSVNAELHKNGWKEVSSNPDALVSYDLVVDKSTREQRDPVYSQSYTRTYYNPYTRRFGTFYYPSQFLGYDTYQTSVKQATVAVSIIDPQVDKTIWQGWATNDLNGNQITSKEVDNNVRSIFKKFSLK